MSEFIQNNDKIGNPHMSDIGTFYASPSCFRYIYHACLILNNNKKLANSSINIVEIGGGYGGLSLAINTFAKLFDITINTYHIIDLDCVTQLQSKYLSMHNITNLITHNADTFGSNIEASKDKPLYLVANYSFSEICSKFQDKYIDILFPKITSGFFLWNFDLNYDKLNKISTDYIIEDERPSYSNDDTKFIYFKR